VAAIFPPPARGGVAPGPSVVNGFSPSNPVIGEGPYYVAPQCSTVLTDAQMNAITSEVLAAVDELGFAFNTSRIDNLGQALRALFDHIADDLASKVARDGDTMSGALVLSGPPVNDNDAANKGYVDQQDAAIAAGMVSRAGDTMSGALILTDDPSAPFEAATKHYVDTQTATGGAFVDAPLDGKVYGRAMAAWKQVVNRAGDTMSGPLILSDDPTALYEAATKQYVDSKLTSGGGIAEAPLDGKVYGRSMEAWAQVLPSNADVVRYDSAQSLTSSQQTQGRQNIVAAPLDALAFGGVQVDGNMEINQAGAGTVSATPAATTYAIDSWAVLSSPTGGPTVSVTQVTDAPPGYRNSLKIAVTTAQPSLSTAAYLILYQNIEGMRIARMALGTAQGMPIGIAFWIKTHRPGLYSGSLNNGPVGNWGCPFPIQVNQADTWEYKTATIPAPPVGVSFSKDGNAGMQIIFNMAAGTNWQAPALQWTSGASAGAAVTGTINGVAATSDTMQITGVVILPGIELPSATRAPLIMRPYEVELPRVQRSYNRISSSIEFTAAGAYNLFSVPLYFPPMRWTPAVSEIAGDRQNIQAVAAEAHVPMIHPRCTISKLPCAI